MCCVISKTDALLNGYVSDSDIEFGHAHSHISQENSEQAECLSIISNQPTAYQFACQFLLLAWTLSSNTH